MKTLKKQPLKQLPKDLKKKDGVQKKELIELELIFLGLTLQLIGLTNTLTF